MVKPAKSLIGVLIVLFVISQSVLIYLIMNVSSENARMINETKAELYEEISLNNKDIQSKINTLINSINSISAEGNPELIFLCILDIVFKSFFVIYM